MKANSVVGRSVLVGSAAVIAVIFAMSAVAYRVRAEQEPEGTPQAQATPFSGVTSSSRNFNPLQVALLHWYDANLVGEITLPNASPFGMAFDGSDM